MSECTCGMEKSKRKTHLASCPLAGRRNYMKTRRLDGEEQHARDIELVANTARELFGLENVKTNRSITQTISLAIREAKKKERRDCWENFCHFAKGISADFPDCMHLQELHTAMLMVGYQTLGSGVIDKRLAALMENIGIDLTEVEREKDNPCKEHSQSAETPTVPDAT